MLPPKQVCFVHWGQCEVLITICLLLFMGALSTYASHPAPWWIFIACIWMWGPWSTFEFMLWGLQLLSGHISVLGSPWSSPPCPNWWVPALNLEGRELSHGTDSCQFAFAVMSCLLCQNCDFLWPPFMRLVMFCSFKGSKGRVYLDLRKLNLLNPASGERNIEEQLFTLQKDSQ